MKTVAGVLSGALVALSQVGTTELRLTVNTEDANVLVKAGALGQRIEVLIPPETKPTTPGTATPASVLALAEEADRLFGMIVKEGKRGDERAMQGAMVRLSAVLADAVTEAKRLTHGA